MARRSSRRRGGGRAERARRSGGRLKQLKWRLVEIRYSPIEVRRPEQIEAIHDTSLRVLEEIGMDFLHPEALDILEKAGADVEAGTQRVRFDRGLIEESIAAAPAGYPLHARNPAHDLRVGGNSINVASVGSPPNVSDLEGRRRAQTPAPAKGWATGSLGLIR